MVAYDQINYSNVYLLASKIVCVDRLKLYDNIFFCQQPSLLDAYFGSALALNSYYCKIVKLCRLPQDFAAMSLKILTGNHFTYEAPLCEFNKVEVSSLKKFQLDLLIPIQSFRD